MDPIGKSPIPVTILVVGKAAVAGSLLFFAFRASFADALLYDSSLTRTLGLMLVAAGLIVATFGFASLGESLSVGLPDEATELKTRGIYRFTRNPIYVGGLLACAGSCVFSIHLLNILLFAVAVAIHHRIVMKEEEFLEMRFGERWRAYMRHVPRYIGIRRTLTTE